MKLKYLLPAVVLAMCTGFSAHAAVGDVVGNIYTTDIAADVDGMPIKSYNIGGRTAIVVEDLREYGFYVEWNEESRMVIVKTEYKPLTYPSYTHVKEAPGNIAGKIYETDIKVTINGLEIPSFNLGGITAVAIEDIVDLPGERYSYDGNVHQGMSKPYADTGMYYVWNADSRTISLNSLRPGDTIETDFGDFVVASRGWSVERMTYIRSPKAFAGRDGKYYSTYSDGLEIDGEIYITLSDVIEIFGGMAEVQNDIVNLRTDVKNAIQMQYSNSLTAKTCFNILYPLKAQLTVNGAQADGSVMAFYAYKGELFVSVSAINSAAGKTLFRNRYDLPEECGESLGKNLYSKHILYINDRAVDSYLADSGEYYIPVDALTVAAFEVMPTPYSRDILSPENLPEIEDSGNNYPSNYFLQDYEGKGYHCEYYESLHEVTIDGMPISSVYIHYTDTHLTPCIPLSELVNLTGYSMKRESENIRVYTREDKLTLGINSDKTAIIVLKDGAVIKEFSTADYHAIHVFGEYLQLAATGDRFGISEVYKADTLEKVIEVKGYVNNIADGKIFAYENTEVDGEWARRHFVYDMEGNLLETYVADR